MCEVISPVRIILAIEKETNEVSHKSNTVSSQERITMTIDEH